MTAADCLWCVLQVTLVGLLSAGVYLVIRRRSPQSATGFLLAGLTLPAVLTAAACSPWPCWITAPAATPTVVNPVVAPPVADEPVPFVSPPPFASAPVDPAPEFLEMPTIETAPAPVVPATPPPVVAEIEWNWSLISLAVMGIMLAIGTVRLVAGWLAIRKLLARSQFVDERQIISTCAELQRTLGCSGPVALRESAPLTTAATVGWRRPTILLPAAWRSWSNVELRAVLAHELAHIARGHYGAWIVAQCGLSLHVYHPLLHWLAARLRLEQEYEADALAARATGGAAAYMRTLAHLALQQPQTPLSWPARAFLARPGAVVRRVQRLQASHEARPSRLVLHAMVLLLILSGAIGAAGLRQPSAPTDAAVTTDSEPDRQPPIAQSSADADNPVATAPDRMYSISGFVIDANDKPVEAATVVLPFTANALGQVEHNLETVTDAKGRYVFEIPRDWLSIPNWQRGRSLWVHKDGFAIGFTSCYGPNGEPEPPFVVHLEPDSPSSFTILDEAGTPVPQAPVSVVDYHCESIEAMPPQIVARCTATTDAAGRVTIPGVQMDRLVTLRTQTESHGIQQFRVYDLPSGEPLTLRETVPLSGRITFDSSTALLLLPNGVAGQLELARNIRLRLETLLLENAPGQRTHGYAEVTTDENGRFEVPRIATGALLIWDRLDPALPVRIHYPKFGPPIIPSEKPLEFPLEPGVLARGRVVRDDNGQPVAGVRVGIGHGEQYQMEHAVTDANGEYQVRIIPEYVTFNTHFIPDRELIDLRKRPAEPIEIPADAAAYQLPDLELHPAETRTGRLAYADGAPAADCCVFGLAERTEYGFTRVDPQGEFAMKLPTGVEITSFAYRTSTGRQGSATVVQTDPLILRAEPIAGVKQLMAAAAGETTGDEHPDSVDSEFLVNNEQGTPIPSGTLHLRGHYDNGDSFAHDRPIEAGRAAFEFQRPLLRELTVSMTAVGFQSHRRQYKVEGTDRGPVAAQYTFQMQAGVTIGGKVVDDAGLPLPGVHVYLNSPSTTREDGSKDYAESWFQTDADGNWSCPGVAPDMRELGLRLEHATHIHESSESLTPYTRPVTPDELPGLRAQTDVRTMREDPPLVGKVVDADGNPVPDVTVEISGRDPDWSQHFARGLVIKSDKTGEFRVPRPPHGEQRLTFTHANGIRQVVEITVPPPEPLTITLSKGSRIEFRVVDTDGQPIPDVTFLPDVSGAEFRGKTDADGRWVWENAPDKKVRFQVLSNDYLCQPPGANYGPEDSPVTLTFRRNLPVVGKVIDAETGAPISEFRLYTGSHIKTNRPNMWEWWMQRSQTLRPVKGSWAEGLVDGKPRTRFEPGEFQHRLSTLDRLIRYRVQADGYLPAVSEPLDAAALPDKPVELEFRLKKYDRIVASIRTPTGEPAADAHVSTIVKRGNESVVVVLENGVVHLRLGTQPTVTVRAERDGRFELPVHNDPFVCVITHESGYLELADRDFADRTELTLLPWKTVEGTVNVRHSPAPGVELSFYRSRDDEGSENSELPWVHHSQSVATDAAGHYRAAYGIPGACGVSVAYPSPSGSEPPESDGHRLSPWQSSTFEIEVKDSEPTTLDVGREGVDVIGRIILPEGVVADWLYSGVEFRRELAPDANGHRRWEWFQARLSTDGTFRCYNVHPGDYQGTAVVGTAEDRVVYGNTVRKRGYEGTLQFTADKFEGRSTTNPVDIGDITLEPVSDGRRRSRARPNRPMTNTEAPPATGEAVAAGPATSETATASAATAAQTPDHITITGRVTEPDGTPADGAMVVLPINLGFGGERRDVAQGTADRDGKYELHVPTEWLNRPSEYWRMQTVWAYQPGFALATASAQVQLDATQPHLPINVILPPESPATFRIVYDVGIPLADAAVEIKSYRSAVTEEHVPQEILQRIAAKSDANGSVTLAAVEAGKLRAVEVRTDRHGQQVFRVEGQPDGTELQVREAVPLRGRIVGERPEWVRGRYLLFGTRLDAASEFEGKPEGWAAVVTDQQGRFEIPRIAVGNLRLQQTFDRSLPVRLEMLPGVKVPCDAPLNLQLVPGIIARGRVVLHDGSQPAAQVRVSVVSRSGYDGQRYQAYTDAAGDFEVRVLPGRVDQLYAEPQNGLVQVGYPERVEIPSNAESFSLPTIEMYVTYKQRGRLVDDSGNPLAQYLVWGAGAGRRFGHTKTDSEGQFELSLPQGVEIERYGCNSPDDVLGEGAVVTADPLILRAEPFKRGP